MKRIEGCHYTEVTLLKTTHRLDQVHQTPIYLRLTNSPHLLPQDDQHILSIRLLNRMMFVDQREQVRLFLIQFEFELLQLILLLIQPLGTQIHNTEICLNTPPSISVMSNRLTHDFDDFSCRQTVDCG